MLNDQLTVKSINDVPKVLYKYCTRIPSISNEMYIHHHHNPISLWSLDVVDVLSDPWRRRRRRSLPFKIKMETPGVFYFVYSV
jgi:hypothetical protein